MSNLDPKNEVKIIQFDTFEVIKNAVNKLVDFVKPTFGPASNKVIISKPTHKMVIDDGVQIARDFELNDPAENAIVNIIKEVAIKTNDRVGDGTTASLIILQAIIKEICKKAEIHGRKIELELKKGLEEIKKQLKDLAIPIETQELLKKVSMVSFDNEEIAEMISSAYIKLGKDGVITIDKSPTMETTIEMTDGIRFDRGYISPYMITNPERMESELLKPSILITDYRITEFKDILPLMEKMAKANKRELVIIAEHMEGSALATAIINKIQGKFLILAVNAPTFGGDRKIALEDIALLTGGKLFSESKGDKLELAELTDLGSADKFICRRDESIIINPSGDKTSIGMSITSLRMAIDNEHDNNRKNQLLTRLGLFTNSLAVIKVGASTENEQKALKYKVEDAVNSVKSAFKHGVVCGGGKALCQLETSSHILNEALKYPRKQLLWNAGISEIYNEKDIVNNIVTGETGNFIDVGVIDPVDALIAGIESAISIASILITSSGIIVEYPKNEDKTN